MTDADGTAAAPASASHDHIEPLTGDECIRRLKAHGVGRLGVDTHAGVGIFPVNYVVDGDSIVVRVRRDGMLDEATDGSVVAFEIDEADSMYHEGWSVLVQGHCVHVRDAGELDTLGRLPLLPWGGTDRDLFLRIAMELVSGRHIHHRAV
jgi:uncharacterized protein